MVPALVDGADGYRVLPVGRYTVPMSDVSRHFIEGRPDQEHRARLWRDFEEFTRGQLKSGLKALSFWLDGSFISGKSYPNDIDFTTIVDGLASQPIGLYDSYLNCGPAWQKKPHPELGRTLAIDAYAIVKGSDGDPAHAAYLSGRGYWDDWWQRSRATSEELSKGYLEVLP